MITVWFCSFNLKAEKYNEISLIKDYRHLAPLSEIIEDPSHTYLLNKFLESDTTGVVKIDPETEIPYMDFTSSSYWMKVGVVNSSVVTKDFYIELARPLTNRITYLILDSAGKILKKVETGDDYPFYGRPYSHRKFIFPESFPPNSKRQIIVKTTSDGEILKLPMKFWELDSFTQFSIKENFFIGIYYGIFILVTILFSLLGVASGERLYVYFVAYVSFLALFQFSLDGFAFQFLWPGSPWLGNHAILIFAALSMISMYLYVDKFLGFKDGFTKFRIGYRVILILLLICLIISFTEGLLYSLMFPVLNGLSFIAILYIIFGIYLKGKQEKRFDIALLLAFVSLSVSSILFILSNVDIISSEFLASNSLKLGSGTELIFLSIAMAGRYRQTQRDKTLAQEQALERLEEINLLKSQQTEKLEAEVKLRTGEIIEKNKELNEKNTEIINSISYAQRLQDAILPSQEELERIFKEVIVFYKPKDIVSGDFYWLQETEDYVYFAVADCTGHGVPGAMVSMIGYNALNRCVQEYHLTDAGRLLDKLKNIVTGTLKSENMKVNDGMDISLCIWDKKSELQFAGAYNSLICVRNNNIIEVKADRQPIGISRKEIDFKTNILNIESGDTFYLYTDGYHDQFGGEEGKKFQKNRFKELLLRTENSIGKEWYDEISILHESWKGEHSQIDDICVMRVKF
ncbi:MAG: hypothetical protein Kapaf2KO_03980 [Candidatus Kapaibacteriales bacterium]